MWHASHAATFAGGFGRSWPEVRVLVAIAACAEGEPLELAGWPGKGPWQLRQATPTWPPRSGNLVLSWNAVSRPLSVLMIFQPASEWQLAQAGPKLPL